MRLDEYAKHDALGLAELIRKGETTPAELRQCALDGIATLNPKLNAVLQVLADSSAPFLTVSDSSRRSTRRMSA